MNPLSEVIKRFIVGINLVFERVWLAFLDLNLIPAFLRICINDTQRNNEKFIFASFSKDFYAGFTVISLSTLCINYL